MDQKVNSDSEPLIQCLWMHVLTAKFDRPSNAETNSDSRTRPIPRVWNQSSVEFTKRQQWDADSQP